ncbi:hypothetical protein fugu_019069 [Takifugu bimaculatus]|uniref:Scavenger receptor class B member 1 n=1 Tax=Takifugu bimaculatus TaxID=433685 RepID=A0A4Z2BJW4_9TELE|nr:hypothetical protein fugu_019069 [Takifugu bimaculatus]
MTIDKAKVALGFIVAGALTLVFGGISVLMGPTVMTDQVIKNTVIDPKNEMSYTMWRDVPVPFFMSVYFFHVLNPKEILAGEKPMVEQRGPYVYRKRIQKDNITFHPNSTVSYKEYRSYYFEPSMSVGNESDVLTLPNMLVLGAAVMLESLPAPVRMIISMAFKTFDEGPFLTKTVGELMWGYDSKLVNFLNKYLPGMLPSSGKFGLFSEFNNSDTGLFTIHTGKDDIRNVHKVVSWNGLTELSYWRTPQCNMINGTAGQMWPPFMTEESTLPFYSPDACRSLELVYQRSGEMKDSPVFISHPHFFNADPVLLDYVHGLSPNEEDHGLFIDIHPLTGVPLNVSIRLQLNLYMKRVRGITETGKISEVVMPMLWFEERGYIDGPILNTFHTNLVVLPAVMEYMQYGMIALGLATIIIAAFVRYRVKRHKCGGGATSEGEASASAGEKDPLLQDDVD